jgi:hypothetical protein
MERVSHASGTASAQENEIVLIQMCKSSALESQLV